MGEDNMSEDVLSSVRYFRRSLLWCSQCRYYAFYPDICETWRVYAKSKQRIGRVYWGKTIESVLAHNCEEIFPKYLQVDDGL